MNSQQKRINLLGYMAFTGYWLLAGILAACNPDKTPSPTSPPSSTPIPAFTASSTLTNQPTQTASPKPTATPRPTVKATAARTRTAPPPPATEVAECPGAPQALLKIGDWARVSVDPPLPNKLRSGPGSSSEQIGQAQPGENLLVLEGPRCADGYHWWLVRDLAGREGWTAEGDAEGYWLVEPISAWHALPEPLAARGAKTYDLREISIAADTALVSGISGDYNPLATPMPRPKTEETPEPDDPRYSPFGTASYAAHSFYELSNTIDGYFWLWIYDLEDPLSRYYLNRMRDTDCTQVLRQNLKSEAIDPARLNPFCGLNGRIPIHFIADVKPIQFEGGKGVRFLIASANYLTINEMEYVFEGLSDDKRYYIRGHFRPVAHPYIVEVPINNDFGPIMAWKEGQYDEAQKSYDAFNARIEIMLNAGVVPLYPSLELLDEMMASIVIK